MIALDRLEAQMRQEWSRRHPLRAMTDPQPIPAPPPDEDEEDVDSTPVPEEPE